MKNFIVLPLVIATSLALNACSNSNSSTGKQNWDAIIKPTNPTNPTNPTTPTDPTTPTNPTNPTDPTNPTTPIQTSSLTGQVTNINTKQPVANATIAVGNSKTVTDTQGNYTLANLAIGDATISVSADGYTAQSLSQTLQATANTLNVTLTPIAVTNPNPPTGISQTGTYRLDPMPSTMATELAQMNSLAQQGYALLGPTESGNLSYKPDGRNMQLEYKAVAGNTNSVAVLNQMGQDGWLYKGPNMDSTQTAYDLYFKDKANPNTYQYQGLPVTEPIIAQANTAGANGWRLYGSMGANADPSTFFNLYGKDNSNTKYEYASEPTVTTTAALRQMIVNRAKDGWLYRGAATLDGQMMNPTLGYMFERPTDNHPALSCDVNDVPDGNTHLATMNDYASKGYLFLGTDGINTGTAASPTFAFADIYCKGINNVWMGLTGPMLP